MKQIPKNKCIEVRKVVQLCTAIIQPRMNLRSIQMKKKKKKFKQKAPIIFTLPRSTPNPNFLD